MLLWAGCSAGLITASPSVAATEALTVVPLCMQWGEKVLLSIASFIPVNFTVVILGFITPSNSVTQCSGLEPMAPLEHRRGPFLPPQPEGPTHTTGDMEGEQERQEMA